MVRSSGMNCTAWVIFVVFVPCLQAQEDKVFRSITPAATEKLLESLKIEFKKSSSKKGDEHYYDFTRNSFKIRLNYFSAQELMLDCIFRGMSIDKINQWNSTTKLTRCSSHKDSNGDFSLLEYGLDLSGGVTEGTIKQFILRFDDELKKYDKYLNTQMVDEAILSNVGSDKIEHILKSIGLTYQKKQNSAGVMMFDFEMHSYKLRLYNFGGKDLMMDVHFRKIPLEDANKYNLSRKFIRVVNYKSKEVEYTALEINFDCEAGVTESMVRHWILSYGEDVKHFSEFAKKLQAPEKKKDAK